MGTFSRGKGYDHDYTDAEINVLKELYLDVNNRVLGNSPEDLTFFTHVCRRNFKSTHFALGAYTTVSELLRNSVLGKIEDEIDLEIYNQAMVEHRKEDRSISYEEILEELESQ